VRVRDQEDPMSDHIYKTVELTGSSNIGSDDAIKKAIARASSSLKHLRWFEVTQVRGQIDGGNVAHWQVTLKVGFTLDE
jgi:flavin-binding protein dodecin